MMDCARGEELWVGGGGGMFQGSLGVSLGGVIQ